MASGRSQEVPDFILSDSESDTGPANIRPRKRQRQNDWTYKEQFDSIKEAKDYIAIDNQFRINTRSRTSDGEKLYYRCKNSNECSSAVFLLLHCDNASVSLFANNEPHNHEDRKDFGLDPQLKLIIADHFSKGISKPNQILKVLRNEGHGEIEKSKLVNFLARLKKQKYGSASFNYGEFENWCEIHSTMPDAEDESYVVGHEVNCDADNDEDRVLRAFISTKRLITLAIHQKLICSDATYKLLWHGFPVLLVGGVDKDKEFHPYGISITKSEAAEDFEFIFRTLKSEVEKIGGTNFDPNILVADSADAITSGFGQAFGNIFQRVNCWSHVARKVDQRLSLIADEATRKEIREDIEILQLVRSEAAFLKASELWRRK